MTIKVFQPYHSHGVYIKPHRDSWVGLAASIEPPTIQVLGFAQGRYTLVKKHFVKLAANRSFIVLGTHQSTAIMGKQVGNWILQLGIPQEYHEPFVQALGRALSKAYGNDVTTIGTSVVPGTPGPPSD